MNAWRIVYATGHRSIDPAALPWLRHHLDRGATWLRDTAGTHIAITGMARGTDLLWADAAHRAGLDVWAFVPHPEQCARWPKRDQRDWQRILGIAAVAHVVGELPDQEMTDQERGTAINRLMFARNRAMLAAAGACFAVWDGRRSGGTFAAVGDASRRGLPGVHLNPRNRTVGFTLPRFGAPSPP